MYDPAPSLTLEDVLRVKHPDAHRWSPAGRWLAFIWRDWGDDHLWLVDTATGEVMQASRAEGGRVTEYAWHPRGEALAYVQDGDLWLLRAAPRGCPPQRVTEGVDVSDICWAPDGHALACVRHGAVWLWLPEPGTVRRLALPGRVVADPHIPPLRWAADGRAIACALELPGGARHVAVVDPAQGQVVWKAPVDEPGGHFLWIDARRFYYAATRDAARRREHYVVEFDAAPRRRLLHVELDLKGLVMSVEPQPSPDARCLVFVLRHTGWDHLFLYDLESGWMRQVTGGACEDLGHLQDAPQWSPDGRLVLFASNRTDPGHRQLWTVDVQRGTLTRLTAEPGTAVEGRWAPDGSQIAYRFCGPRDAVDLWLVGAQGGAPRRLTTSLPERWTRDKIVAPTHVTFAAARGWTVHGYLYTPPRLQQGLRYPALVWVHGDPMHQVHEGWHPLYPYAVVHAFTQYLAHRGYVTLAVNVRGSAGYGVAFEQGTYLAVGVDDVADVVAAGQVLRSLPYVDANRIGVWGIFRGGHLALAALTKHPGAFALGINIAGVWDAEAWLRWARRHYRTAAGYVRARLGGDEAAHGEVWRQASPRHWVAQMRAPLVNFHGTRDEAVPFEQLDLLVADCVAHGKRFEAHHYPGESHVFSRRATWADVFRKIERALARYLGTPAASGADG
ncbi:MAG: prolyl oligopeptidase family serine peptidase [Firmicutes bacterium]|nr:prolyl oligopeptidase family serine peptidase [Bacillota bacterium]